MIYFICEFLLASSKNNFYNDIQFILFNFQLQLINWAFNHNFFLVSWVPRVSKFESACLTQKQLKSWKKCTSSTTMFKSKWEKNRELFNFKWTSILSTAKLLSIKNLNSSKVAHVCATSIPAIEYFPLGRKSFYWWESFD